MLIDDMFRFSNISTGVVIRVTTSKSLCMCDKFKKMYLRVDVGDYVST